MKCFLVAFLLVFFVFSAEMVNGDVPIVPPPTGKWCGYSVAMNPCDNDVCDKFCMKDNTHGWLLAHGMCTSIPSLKDCYCVHQCP